MLSNVNATFNLCSVFESILYFKQNKNRMKDYKGDSQLKKYLKIPNHKISFFYHFPKYEMIKFYNVIPKYECIQEENSIIKFKYNL